MKMMELTRTKQREEVNRLSQPNRELVVAAPAKSKPRRRKRPRNDDKDPVRTRSSSDRAHYSSSDDDDDENRDGGGFGAGLASYKELLSSLEHANAAEISAAGEGDEDLASAVAFRRMQREGLEGYGSESQTDEEEEEEEDGEEDRNNGVGRADDLEELGEEDLKANGDDGVQAEGDGGDPGASSVGRGSEGDTEADDVDRHQDVAGHDDSSSDESKAVARSKDEFGRHFVATPVFTAEQATEKLSASGRPSLKPLSGSHKGKYGALGLSVTASRNTEVPPPLPPGGSVAGDLGVLPSLAVGWDECIGGETTALQSLLLPPLTGYRDMLYCGWRDEDALDIRRCYALHALNHALTSRRRVVRHNARLRKAAEVAKVAEAIAQGGGEKEPRNGESVHGSATVPTVDTESDEWQRDQGFTRPKVLILLPFRGVAHELLEIMIELLGPKTVVINKDRFDEEYGPDNEDDALGEEEAGSTPAGEERAERARAALGRKPEDWKALMGDGRNVDDMFTLGLSLSPGGGKGKPGEGKGVAVRLYCDFYNSDIILASPVALHRACVPSEDGESGGGGAVDADFLSSIEICVMDRADVFLMQNWAYVPEIAEVLNTRPKGERAARVDFSRVRPLFLHEQGRIFRQTLVLSAFQVGCVVRVLSSHLFLTPDLWTHQPRSHRRKVIEDFSTFLRRCLPHFSPFLTIYNFYLFITVAPRLCFVQDRSFQKYSDCG